MAAPRMRSAHTRSTSGKSRGKSSRTARPSRNFHTSRTAEAGAELELKSPALELSDNEDFSDSSDEASIGGDAASSSAYATLLQALNPTPHAGPPPAKKRKVAAERANLENWEKRVSAENSHNGATSHLEEVDKPEAEDGNAASAAGSDEDLDDSDGEAPNKHDAFDEHFNPKDDARLAQGIEAVKQGQGAPTKSVQDSSWKVLAFGQASTVKRGTVKSLEGQGIKQKLQKHLARNGPDLDHPITSLAAQSVLNYEDVLICDRPIAQGQNLRKLMALHALNHVMKTRDRVMKNNERLAKQNGTHDGDCRDQGFTRPKVLFLLPTRQSCAKVVDALMALYDSDQQENKKRFQDAFSDPQDSISVDKPEDFRDLFGGNDDDMFRIGLKFTRRTVKFFSQFYSSDIILASPLGLRMAIGAEASSKQDFDFLSSIELLVLDQTDAMLMQNWDHVEFITSHLNLHPKDDHGCDFSRARSWYLDGNARYLRQTIVLAAFNTPELNKIFGNQMLNIAGRVKISTESYDGTLSSFGGSFKQTFLRFDAEDPASEPSARFKYFTTKILPNIAKRTQTGAGPHGIVIFVPSYLDFVRVRNFMAGSVAAQDIAFASISEYTSAKEVARARSHFLTGRHAVLLYSGRAHHFRRYQLKGIKSVFFYGLPDNALFYKEMTVDFLGRSLAEGLVDQQDVRSQALFSRWDAMRLERIVGTERVGAMVGDPTGDTFTFS